MRRILHSAAMALAASAMLAGPSLPPPGKHALPISIEQPRKTKRKGKFGGKMFKRHRYGNRYTPAGPGANVRGTYVKNPATAFNVNKMHNAWYEKKFGQQDPQTAFNRQR